VNRAEYETRKMSDTAALNAELAALADTLVAGYSKPVNVSPSTFEGTPDEYDAAVRAQASQSGAYLLGRRNAEAALSVQGVPSDDATRILDAAEARK
jgi:hypothetical protein